MLLEKQVRVVHMCKHDVGRSLGKVVAIFEEPTAGCAM